MKISIDLEPMMESVKTSLKRPFLRRAFILGTLASTWLVFLPALRAVSPPPDGGYPNQNTAEGEDALFSITSSGSSNTAIGFDALFANGAGRENTAIGANALLSNIANNNTATGANALSSNTIGIDNTATGANALVSNLKGSNNTANGSEALARNKIGDFNTATGARTLLSNTSGEFNTATGVDALHSNTTGNSNTATGLTALLSNTTGFFNTATGAGTLLRNTTGSDNTATGVGALQSNTTGVSNTANGEDALFVNTTGNNNAAIGLAALASNATGSNNTAIGLSALSRNTTGSNNIGIGQLAGQNLTTGSYNIEIGNHGRADDSRTIRLGALKAQRRTFIAGISGVTVADGVAVVIDSNGQLGTLTSSARYKDGIKPMDKASEAILALQPVTFRYKHDCDPKGIPQFGLVAEQVEKVNPDLVACDEEGKPYTVRYEAVNAMLLNEFLKEHRKVEEQDATIAELKGTVATQAMTIARNRKGFESAIAQEQREIKALTANLKEQARQIQKVSDQLQTKKAAPRLVAKD